MSIETLDKSLDYGFDMVLTYDRFIDCINLIIVGVDEVCYEIVILWYFIFNVVWSDKGDNWCFDSFVVGFSYFDLFIR